MSKPKTCIRIAGTRTGRIRARVEEHGVTTRCLSIGGEKWFELDPETQRKILDRAARYLDGLTIQLTMAEQFYRHDHLETPQ
jgi:hypothetical protein